MDVSSSSNSRGHILSSLPADTPLPVISLLCFGHHLISMYALPAYAKLTTLALLRSHTWVSPLRKRMQYVVEAIALTQLVISDYFNTIRFVNVA
jgi:hypothetical protein